MNSDEKRCPYCGGIININAKKCKHCGEWLKEANVYYNPNNSCQEYKPNPALAYDIAGLIFAIIWFLALIAYMADPTQNLNDPKAIYSELIFVTLFPLTIGIIGMANKNKGLSVSTIILSLIIIIISVGGIAN